MSAASVSATSDDELKEESKECTIVAGNAKMHDVEAEKAKINSRQAQLFAYMAKVAVEVVRTATCVSRYV